MYLLKIFVFQNFFSLILYICFIYLTLLNYSIYASEETVQKKELHFEEELLSLRKAQSELKVEIEKNKSLNPIQLKVSTDFFNYIDNKENDSPVFNTWNVRPQIDYQFNESTYFHAQMNWENTGSEEHSAGSTQKGQTRTEEVYLDLNFSSWFHARMGQQFLPLGIINPHPEGINYLGVSPPEVETQIIPSAWSENGIMIWGHEGLKYTIGAFNSLEGTHFTTDTFIRSGRQNGQLTHAKNIALVARLEFLNEVFSLGVSSFVGASNQEQTSSDNGTVTLSEGHMQILWRGFLINGLYAEGKIDNPDSLSITAPHHPQIPLKAKGQYFTFAINLLRPFSDDSFIGKDHSTLPLFIEWSQYDLNDQVPSSFSKNLALNRQITKVGLNYRFAEQQIAIKSDYQFRRNKLTKEQGIFSLGISLIF